jgi:hypothetical protein
MALPQLTQNQLDKLIRRPNWLDANTAIAGQVFASNEGWMLSPTKIHPEGKRMPAECVVAIPRLSEYIEYNQGGVTPTEYVAEQSDTGKIFFRSISITRRSRSRYIVNIAMDEAIQLEKTSSPSQLNFNFTASVLESALTIDGNSFGSPIGWNTSAPSQFTINDGESSGRIQIDLNFSDPVESVSITPAGTATWGDIVTASQVGTPVIKDTDNKAISVPTPADIDAAFANIPQSDRWNPAGKGTITVVP